MSNYKTRRIQEVRDYMAAIKTKHCSAPIIKIIANIETVHDYLIRGAFIPPFWANDADLVEFEIVPVSDTGVFVKRGYPFVQYHVASWESMQPSVTFFMEKIPVSGHHLAFAVAQLPQFTLLKTRLPNVVMVEFTPVQP